MHILMMFELIASSSKEEHAEHVRAVLQHFNDHGIIINPDKCQFVALELVFLVILLVSVHSQKGESTM